MTDVPATTPMELYDRLRARELTPILDVRDRGEYETWRIKGPTVESAQVPYARFVQAQVTGSAAELVPENLEEPLLVVCARGEASQEVAAALREEGMDAANLVGGTTAWADLLVPHDVTQASGVDVIQYERPATGCLSYLVVAEDEAAVVDPLRAFADRYAAAATERSAELRYAIDTHVHADHVSGVRAVAEETGAERVLPANAAARGLNFDAHLVDDGEELELNGMAFTFAHAPGHTSGLHVVRIGNVAFTADCLFLDSVGRPDLERADDAGDLADKLYASLHDIVFAFPNDTLVAPGHVAVDSEPATDGSYTCRLGELRGELGLSGLNREAFVERVATDLPPRPANYETIIRVNLGQKDLDQEILDLELGPNNCAVD